MPKKKKTIAKLVDAAAVLLQKYVRLKAADENGYCKCVTCGRSYHWKEMDGGHFISRVSMATKLLEENVHPQCKNCNGFHKNEIGYTLFMIDYYGRDFVEDLHQMKYTIKKYIRSEVEEMIQDLRQKIKELE